MERALHAVRLLDQKGVPIPHSMVLNLIQNCCKAKDLTAGRQLFLLLAKNGLDKVVILGNHLIRMFTSCNSLIYANEAFHKVAKPDAYTWNAIISAHAKLGQFDEAFNLYNLMLKADVRPNIVTFLCILKACSGARALQHGRLIHDHITRSKISGALTVKNTLLDMYAKCGSLEEAERVFSGVLNRDVVTFGVILTGYVQHEHGVAALQLYARMHEMGVQPSDAVYISVLKACIIITSAVHGRRIHDSIVRNGLDSDGGQVGSMLIEMYTKCGSLQEAHQVFDSLQNRDVVIWCSLIAGYSDKGYDLQVLELFEDMQKVPLQPERVTFIYIMKACGSLHAFKHGLLIHNMIIKCFLDTDIVVANSIIDMYVKWGDLSGASSIFDMLSLPDAVSWGTMIAGYVHFGHDHLALGCFGNMQHKATKPDKPVLLLMLKVCGNTGEQGKGSLIHHVLVDAGLQSDTVMANALIYMYGQFMGLKEATCIFDNMPDKNVDTWETLIAAYCHDAKYSLKVLELFEKVQRCVKPSKGMFLCSLKACGGLTAVREGKVLHDELIRSEYELDEVVENTLMNMYGKCGLLKEACNIFDRMLKPNEVSWGAIIDGHVGCGQHSSALKLFERMQIRGMQANTVLSSSILKACGNKGAIQHGRIIHHKVIRNALATTDVSNSLVYFYARCGSMDEAQKIFDSISSKTLASWGALLAGYTRHMNGLKAVDLYRTMHQGRIQPNKAILLLALQACGMTGALMEGHLVYMQILEDGFRLDGHLGNTLLDMYARCGRVQDAFYVFSMLPTHDMVSWGVMMAGFVRNSECKRVEWCFRSMKKQGLKPGDFIFTSILAACSHAGLLEEGLKYLNVMMLDHGLLPDRKHYSCLSDLLGRAGHFREAVDLFQSMPMPPDIVLWTSLLDSCETHGNRRLATHCFEELCDTDPGDASWYVLMSNICSDVHAPMEVHQMASP